MRFKFNVCSKILKATQDLKRLGYLLGSSELSDFREVCGNSKRKLKTT